MNRLTKSLRKAFWFLPGNDQLVYPFGPPFVTANMFKYAHALKRGNDQEFDGWPRAVPAGAVTGFFLACLGICRSPFSHGF
jgi:hypothetical protein